MTDRVQSIHIAAEARAPMTAVERVAAEAGLGLVGDRYHGSSKLQVTVQAAGELAAAAAEAGAEIDPGRTRRNITVTAESVPRDPGHRWRIGPVELEVVRDAPPCRRMDEIFGDGGRAALRRRAGVICMVLTDGEIAIGDPVDLNPSPSNP